MYYYNKNDIKIDKLLCIFHIDLMKKKINYKHDRPIQLQYM